MLTVNSVSALLSMNPSTSNEVYVAGYYTPGDLGGGEFYYDPTSSTTPNNGTIFQSSYTPTGRWFRVINGTQANARWFGAYGNGLNDDTSALQSAINYCGSVGMALYISRGTYIVSSSGSGIPCLTIGNSGFFMEGDGINSEIKNANNTPTQGLLMIKASTGQIQNIIVKNLSFNGNKANQSGVWSHKCVIVYCLTTTSTAPANVTLEGLYCHDTYSNDAVSNEAGGISILGDDFGYSLQEYPSQNIIIKGCFCWNNVGWGIGTNFSNGVIISNNICWNNSSQGITVWNSQDCVVNGNKSYGNGSCGINVEISDRIIITSNDVRSSQYACIRLFNSVDSVINSNNCELNSSFYLFFGIGLLSGKGYNSGAYKTRPCQNVQISNNNVRSIGADAYAVAAYVDSGYGYNQNINVSDNVIINTNIGKGVYAAANDFTLVDNKITGYLYMESSSGFVILDSNDIVANNRPSLFNLVTISTCLNLVIKANTFRCNQNGYSAIILTQYNPHAIVFDNIYQGAFSNFIVLNGAAVMPVQRDNLNW